MEVRKVQGTKMFDLFRYLVESKKILSLQVIGTRFECLTFVTEFKDNTAIYTCVNVRWEIGD